MHFTLLVSCLSISMLLCFFIFFFFNDTATTEIYTLSLHDALPISRARPRSPSRRSTGRTRASACSPSSGSRAPSSLERSEEHTSELQSPCNLVCRLLLEKKKKNINTTKHHRATSHSRYSITRYRSN